MAAMTLSLIAAVSDNGVIGIRNGLPWHLPDDLAHFRALTLGKSIIMGRKTFESIGRALPERRNIVITRGDGTALEGRGAIVVHSLDDALSDARGTGAEEALVIGGADIYAQTMRSAERLYMTHVHVQCDGDAYFPPIPALEWRETERADHAADAEHAHSFSFVTYERRLLLA